VIIRDQDGKQDIGLVELGNMDVKIKYDKLFSAFEKLMEPYSNLDHTEKSYDYWAQGKMNYVDWDVLNFYHNIEEDYEDDDWVMQYQNEPGDEGRPEDLPTLTYGQGYSFPNIETMFNQYFDELLKDWFEKTYGFEVKTINKI
jgi:hypothetical protein